MSDMTEKFDQLLTRMHYAGDFNRSNIKIKTHKRFSLIPTQLTKFDGEDFQNLGISWFKKYYTIYAKDDDLPFTIKESYFLGRLSEKDTMLMLLEK